MIKILVQNSRHAPIIVCDVCGQIIDDAKRGAAVFKNVTSSGATLSDGTMIDVLHSHKGHCHDVAEAQLGGQELTGWIELEEHIRFLVHNSGLKLQDLLEQDKLDKEVGTL